MPLLHLQEPSQVMKTYDNDSENNSMGMISSLLHPTPDRMLLLFSEPCPL